MTDILIPCYASDAQKLLAQYDLPETLYTEDQSFYFHYEGTRAHVVILSDKSSPQSVAKDITQYFSTIPLKDRSISILPDHIFREEHASGVLLGLYQHYYDAGLCKSDHTHDPFQRIAERIHINETENTIFFSVFKKSNAIGGGQHHAMDIVNLPANKKTPEKLVQRVEQIFKDLPVDITVWDEHRCAEEGLHAFLGVNRGSEYGGRFVIMRYRPAQSTKHIGWVGKGVTFDTGGVSIKGSANMHFMTSDLGGAAAVVGALYAMSTAEAPLAITAIVPFTDNAVDAKSIQPSDVLNSHSGQTIEIIDTDAEGRLCLADALSYIIKNDQPDIVINLATLTGSVVQTLGYQAAGLFTANEDLAEQLIQAGDASGDRVWRLPLWDEYKKDLDSDVADLKNFSGRRVAGAISAALFLQRFTHEHPCWAHLDIAGVAFGQRPDTSMRAATGYGVYLLYQWVESLLNN